MQEDKAKVTEHPQLDTSTGFDNRVHIKDAKSGKIIRLQHYARHSQGNEVLFERPIGSGNAFTENGNPVGRYDFKKWTKISDTHIAVAQPPANRTEELEQHNAALEQELAALKAEAEARVAYGDGQKAKAATAVVQKK